MPLLAQTTTEPWVTYAGLISLYFPADQVPNATCILETETLLRAPECGSTPPESCVVSIPDMSCYSGQAVQPAKAYGLYGIVDVCWNPALAGSNTPFTADEWAKVLDPNYNVWMASVIFSIAGWRAWTTCPACPNCPPCVYANPPCLIACSLGICSVAGEPVPYPRGPTTPGTAYGGVSPWIIYGAIGVSIYALAAVDLGWL